MELASTIAAEGAGVDIEVFTRRQSFNERETNG
jgi:hypothetical protein